MRVSQRSWNAGSALILLDLPLKTLPYQLSSVNQSNQNQDSVEPIGDIQKEVPFVDYLDQVAFGWLTELIELTYAMLRSGAFMSLRRWHPLNDTIRACTHMQERWLFHRMFNCNSHKGETTQNPSRSSGSLLKRAWLPISRAIFTGVACQEVEELDMPFHVGSIKGLLTHRGWQSYGFKRLNTWCLHVCCLESQMSWSSHKRRSYFS